MWRFRTAVENHTVSICVCIYSYVYRYNTYIFIYIYIYICVDLKVQDPRIEAAVSRMEISESWFRTASQGRPTNHLRRNPWKENKHKRIGKHVYMYMYLYVYMYMCKCTCIRICISIYTHSFNASQVQVL